MPLLRSSFSVASPNDDVMPRLFRQTTWPRRCVTAAEHTIQRRSDISVPCQYVRCASLSGRRETKQQWAISRRSLSRGLMEAGGSDGLDAAIVRAPRVTDQLRAFTRASCRRSPEISACTRHRACRRVNVACSCSRSPLIRTLEEMESRGSDSSLHFCTLMTVNI